MHTQVCNLTHMHCFVVIKLAYVTGRKERISIQTGFGWLYFIRNLVQQCMGYGFSVETMCLVFICEQRSFGTISIGRRKLTHNVTA